MKLEKISTGVWEIPPSEKPGMRVPARILSSETLLKALDQGVFNQITNVATLPGIRGYAYCMPDGHWGYGFPIGGVAAFDLNEGVISPGGIGFDINCGIRLLRTSLTLEEVSPRIKSLIDTLYQMVPCGVGSKGFIRLKERDYRHVLVDGARWCVENGYGEPQDQDRIEERGRIEGANPDKISRKALDRGLNQLGTLGSGNHFLEIQVVKPENIYDRKVAEVFGLDRPNQITVMIHCGSRGFGHQIGTDYLQIFGKAMQRYGISTGDRELACAPFTSAEGQDYYAAMKCAANSAFANRQVITHQIRQAFAKTLNKSPESLGMDIVYDVAHNIAKEEEYELGGRRQRLLVHRKGATRAFGPGQRSLPEQYRQTGQPVIVGGSMETGSFLLVGTEQAMTQTFGSTLHGAGRTLSRSKAKKMVRGDALIRKMMDNGIVVRAASMPGLAEEAGFAYKDIAEVVEAVDDIGISRKVAQMLPIGNIKG
jgi:tRNA-splicing ligase RtcB